MKTIIIYASKYGATKNIVDCLAEKINGEVTIRNIKDKIEDLSNFDTVIIGGSIYMNKIQKSITSYLKKHENELMNKNLGLFICCYTEPGTKGYLEQFFPESLMKVAKAKGMLGGVMQYDKMNFIYRKIFQSLKKIDGFNEGFKEPKIEMDLIEKFAKEMN